MTHDDAGPRRTKQYHADAQAARMLAESLLITLIECKIVPAEKVLATVEAVIDTKRQMTEDGVEPEVARIAIGILSTMVATLSSVEKEAKAHPSEPEQG